MHQLTLTTEIIISQISQLSKDGTVTEKFELDY